MEESEIAAVVKAEVENIAGTQVNDLNENIFFKGVVLDSLNMLHLILFLEQRFKIKIDPFFTDRESISSINKIAAFIKKRV